MPSLLFVVFMLQLAIHLINTVGANAVNELAWILYNKLPTPTTKEAQEAAKLSKEVVRLYKEMSSVSAQDDFARWAKLRRAHDKAKDQYDKSSNNQQSFKTNFGRGVTALRWLATNGLRFFLQFYYSKAPLFWLPQGWVPFYVEWILAFPRAPTGSISIQIWGAACASVIVMLGEGAMAVHALQTGNKLSAPPREEKPVKMADVRGNRPGSGKKEL